MCSEQAYPLRGNPKGGQNQQQYPHRMWFADLPSAAYRALGINLRAEHRV